jgi:hypothetical protein
MLRPRTLDQGVGTGISSVRMEGASVQDEFIVQEIGRWEGVIRELLDGSRDSAHHRYSKLATLAMVFEAIGTTRDPVPEPDLCRRAARHCRDRCVALGSPIDRYRASEWTGLDS